MAVPQVFIETNFLFDVFRMPSKRHGDALALRAKFDAGQIKFYLPYLCLQEARHLISKNLPNRRVSDLLDFHNFATKLGNAAWNFAEIKKLLDAAAGEVSRTKALYQKEIAEFAVALGDGVLHGTQEVFDFLESLELDDDYLKYNDKLILCSILIRASQLHTAGIGPLYFASVDKSDLQPTQNRPKLTKYFSDAGLDFVPGFVLPEINPLP